MNWMRDSVVWGALVAAGGIAPAFGQFPEPGSSDGGQFINSPFEQPGQSQLRQTEWSQVPVAPVPTGETPVWATAMEQDKSDAGADKKDSGESKKEDKEKKDDKDDELKAIKERLKKLEDDDSDFGDWLSKKEEEAGKEPTFSLGGRIHLDTWMFNTDDPGIGFFEHPATGADPEDRIFFRRIRLEAGGDVFETMLYRVQIDFHAPGTGEYKDVYIGFKELPLNHTILFGNQKRPIGLDHLNSSRFNVYMERPFTVEAFNEDARRVGACAYTYTDDYLFNIRYGLFLLENTTSSGNYVGDSLQGSGNFRVACIPWYDEASDGRGYYHCALSGMLARPDGNVDPTDSNANEGRFRTRSELRSDSRWLDTGRIAGAQWYEIIGLESMFNYGPLQVTAEQQFNWTQRDDVTAGTGPDLFFHGGYVFVSYFLTGEHIPIDRKSSTIKRTKPFENFFLVERLCGGTGTGWGAWQVALRASYLDLTNQDIQGGVGHNLTFGLNWWWTSHSRMQVNLIRGNVDQ
ncbi:MAG: hypothetical protein KDA84_05555, partial [Planctomycetaceae bacterium]|nr:hypothetical protein [Planctomycetaceae bacterium]